MLFKELNVDNPYSSAADIANSAYPVFPLNLLNKITESTKDIFVECTGNNLSFIKKALNIMITALSDMGGEVYQMEIIDAKKELSPNLEPEKMPFHIENVNKLIGINLNEKDIKNYLEKMGIDYLKEKINS